MTAVHWKLPVADPAAFPERVVLVDLAGSRASMRRLSPAFSHSVGAAAREVYGRLVGAPVHSFRCRLEEAVLLVGAWATPDPELRLRVLLDDCLVAEGPANGEIVPLRAGRTCVHRAFSTGPNGVEAAQEIGVFATNASELRLELVGKDGDLSERALSALVGFVAAPYGLSGPVVRP